MTKYILIGGKIHNAKDGGVAFCNELLRSFDRKDRPIKILDCLFARKKEDWNSKIENDIDFFSRNLESFELELAKPEKFVEQVQGSDVIFFQGGNPRLLMEHLEVADSWLKNLTGKIIVGSSGGADAIVKYYGVGKTSNIGEGLGLLPIKFIPHWKSISYQKDLDFKIDWERLLNKLKSHKEDLEVVILTDGEFIVFNN